MSFHGDMEQIHREHVIRRPQRSLTCSLKVPKIRSIIEYVNFLVLFCLYVLAMEGLEDHRMNWRELAFIIYASGMCMTVTRLIPAFSLDKLAAVRERGVKGEPDDEMR